MQMQEFMDFALQLALETEQNHDGFLTSVQRNCLSQEKVIKVIKEISFHAENLETKLAHHPGPVDEESLWKFFYYIFDKTIESYYNSLCDSPAGISFDIEEIPFHAGPNVPLDTQIQITRNIQKLCMLATKLRTRICETEMNEWPRNVWLRCYFSAAISIGINYSMELDFYTD